MPRCLYESELYWWPPFSQLGGFCRSGDLSSWVASDEATWAKPLGDPSRFFWGGWVRENWKSWGVVGLPHFEWDNWRRTGNFFQILDRSLGFIFNGNCTRCFSVKGNGYEYHGLFSQGPWRLQKTISIRLTSYCSIIVVYWDWDVTQSNQ